MKHFNLITESFTCVFIGCSLKMMFIYIVDTTAGVKSVPHDLFSADRLSRWLGYVQKLAKAGTILLVTGSAACTAHNSGAQKSMGFSCTVSGAKLTNSGLNEATVCAQFRAKIEEVLFPKTVVAQTHAATGGGHRISVDIRYTKSGSIIAAVREENGANGTTYPEIAVDVSDRPIGQQDVNLLATEVARAIAGKQDKQ